MSYPSVDALQKTLSDQVFHYTQDSKKASGRALGTLVEIIAFYTLRSWGFRNSIAIERPLPEYGNPEISHNVEFSCHPIISQSSINMEVARLPLSTSKIRKAIHSQDRADEDGDKSSQLISSDHILRNSCLVSESKSVLQIANLDEWNGKKATINISELYPRPFAIFECKRVGVEEGMSKGPQTIEKAKQGAYVARTASSLQKVRLKDGRMGGLIHPLEGDPICEPYETLIREIIASETANLLRDFVLTVGVVSNHGNWFSSENQNKELKVLAQSYDWLLFLTDAGLAQFIHELLLEPRAELLPARKAFLDSYSGKKGKNRFTKVKMDMEADQVLINYFQAEAIKIASWFNIITPSSQSLNGLKEELTTLSNKEWNSIHR